MAVYNNSVAGIIWTRHKCGERLGTYNGHDKTHYGNESTLMKYYDDSYCKGRGYTQAVPTSVNQIGEIEGYDYESDDEDDEYDDESDDD